MATSTRLGTLALAAGVLAALLACKKGNNCPGRYEDLTPEQKASAEVECGCAAGVQGTVWGTGVYTTDSNLCAAAVHAGAVPAGGGAVKIVKSAGCPAYSGSTANGITTGGWGPYSQSFYFAGHGDGKCAAAPAATAPPVVAPPKPGECPRNFASIPGANDSTEFSCDCSGAGSGSVWGSGIYTRDSDLCKAAVHAGAISASGGKITVKAAPGCPKYSGSTANGIATGAWGSYQGSFYFPSKNDGKCR